MAIPFFPQFVDQYEFQNSGLPPWFYFGQPQIGWLFSDPGSGYNPGDVLHPDVPLSAPYTTPSQWTVDSVDGTGGITSFTNMYYDAPYLYTDFGGDLTPALIGGTGTGANYGHPTEVFGWSPLVTCTTLGAGMASSITAMTITYWACADVTAPAPTGGIVQGSDISPIYTDFPDVVPANPSDGVTISCFLIGGGFHTLQLSLRVSLCQDSSTFPTLLYDAIHGGFVPILHIVDGPFTYDSTNIQVMVSFDTSSETMQVYVNDTLLPVVSGPEWNSAGSLNNSVYHWSISSFNAVGDLWINDSMIDLSVEANRRQWINADLSAVNLPSNGALSGGATPKVFLHTTATGAPGDFSANNGSGPGWTLYSPALYPDYTASFSPLQPNYSDTNGNLIPLEFHFNDGCLTTSGSPPTSSLIFTGIRRETLALVRARTGPIPVFPTLPAGFPVKLSAVMDTIIGTVKSLREMRVAQQQVPLWDIEIVFEELRDQTQNQSPYAPFASFTQFQQLCELFMMMYGRTGVFAFDAPWDHSRELQQIGIGDGSTYIFTVYRTWGLDALETNQAVGVVNEITAVYFGGGLVNPEFYFTRRNKIYFIDANGDIHPPGLGVQISMTFTFYYLCRFIEDEQDFEEFSKNRWTVPSMKFRAVIWP